MYKSIIEQLNYTSTWNHCIKNVSNLDKDTEYELHATGDADLNGRKYVALKKGIKITPEIKKEYNLM